MSEAQSRGLSLAVTSIGYDGEDRDTITGLPKPKVVPPRGAILATSDKCAAASTTRLLRLGSTPVSTPLGCVALWQVLEPGKIAIAGPNNARDLRLVLSRFRALGVDLALVDGALSRVYPMREADCLVVSTGPSRFTDLMLVAKEVEAIFAILSLGTAPPLTQVLDWPSIVTPDIMDTWPSGAIRVPSPVCLLASHEPINTRDALARCRERGTFVYVERRLPLAAFTVNPVFPEDVGGGQFCYSQLDIKGLVTRMSELGPPVLDAVREGAGKLVDAILGASAKGTPWEA